jgi:WD40 repeat protein
MTRALPLLTVLAWFILAPASFAESEENDKPRLDVYGDPLPDGAVMRLGTTRFRVGGLVNACAYSPDGKTIAASSTEPTVRLFDAATGRRIHELTGHKESVTCLSYSPDGRLLASASINGRICLHDTDSGKMIRRFGHEMERIWCLAFLPGGKTLATGGENGAWNGQDYPVRIWDIGTGKEIRVISGHPEIIRAMVVSPDGKLLAVAGGYVNAKGVIRLVEIKTGKLLYTLQDRKQMIHCLAFSPDGKRLVSGGTYTLCLWDITNKKIANCVAEAGANVQAAAFSPDGKLLAAANDACGFFVWEAATGRKLHQSAGRSWSRKERGPRGGITCLAFSPDGRSLVYGVDRSLKILNCNSWTERHPVTAHDAAVGRIQFADSKTLTTLGDDERLLRWDLGTAKATALLAEKSRFSSVDRTALSPDQKALAVCNGPDIQLWDTATGEKIRSIPLFEKHPVANLTGQVIYSPDGRWLATTILDHGSLRVWDAARGKEITRLGHFSNANGIERLDLSCVIFSPDNRTIAAPSDNECDVVLYAAQNGKRLRELSGVRSREVRRLAFSSDGRMLASGVYDDGPINVWELRTGGLRLQLRGHNKTIHELAFSRNSRWLASTSQDGIIRLWDTLTGKLIHNWRCHEDSPASAAFSTDDRLLATGGRDTTVLLWDMNYLLRRYTLKDEKLAASTRQELWSDLSQQDAARAYRAMDRFVRSSASIAFFKERLNPARRADDAAIARLLQDLDSDQFAVREKAQAELVKMGETIEACLRRALANWPTLELRRRVELLLEKLLGPRLRAVRAVEVLERIDNPEARALLAELAKGDPAAELTTEANAALERLRRRTEVKR